MKKYVYILGIIVVILFNVFKLYFYEDDTVFNEDIKINEEVEVLEYNNTKSKKVKLNEKKDINNVNYIDLIEIGISDKMSNEILNYIEFKGTIENFNEFKKISRFSNSNIEKLKNNFVINKGVLSIKKHNINELSEKELIYLGISKKEREKILEYTKKNKITDRKTLYKLINEKTIERIENQIKFN